MTFRADDEECLLTRRDHVSRMRSTWSRIQFGVLMTSDGNRDEPRLRDQHVGACAKSSQIRSSVQVSGGSTPGGIRTPVLETSV